ncbi:hypothetical protein F0562_017747 [Nyssa sinensis]|uniref:KOW domain-containing protein n=1 Tax=Nyssa sinensis TaxID=561372 RepID=A0A5J4ZHT1_9ASTE|nr:hypothetical protein F0562_017747 [Nyssa sinensis]
MMQLELLEPSWSFYDIMDSTCDEVGVYGLHMDEHIYDPEFSFSSSFTTNEDSSGISSDPFSPTLFVDEFVNFPISNDELQDILSTETVEHDMEGLEPILGGEFGDICSWLNEGEGEDSFPSQQLSIEGDDDTWSPSLSMKSSEASTVLPSINLSMALPGDDMEIDNQLSIHHLLQAYGEAMEMEHRELEEVIVRCISEKVNPVGKTLERIAFNLFQSTEKEGEYLKQESSKNFEAAFKAFYQIFPYGRFAHFAANSAILEAIPDDAETIHIVDFNMGEGIQWPPMFEALGPQQKTVRLTSIRSREDDCSSPRWRFEEIKRQLYNHAASFGLRLKVEQTSIEDLVSEIKKTKKRGGKREWLAFNCMVGLPHMGRGRSRSHVMEFLRVAMELITNSATNGIIAFGDGDAGEKLKYCSGYGSFFDGYLAHYQALCESMEWNFPIDLAEARIAMESLFVAPYVSSFSWFQKWEEMREGSDLQAEVGLEGCRLSIANLMEAKEMVKEEESLYTVKIEGQKENEMVLEWRGTPLVSISTWREVILLLLATGWRAVEAQLCRSLEGTDLPSNQIKMARGLKKHLKRLNAPKHWMLDKLGGAFAPKPSSGPHKSRECLPLILILRNRLKYALTYREVIAILMQRHVLVDGKVRTDKTYPAGFMDVVSIPKTNENFRLLYDTKGRFRLHSIRDEEAKFKLCKVRSVQFGQKGIPYINTYDGRTIRYPDPLIKANDTIKLDLETNKITEFIKFDVGNVVMVTGGRNRGRVGVIKNREKHKGSFETVHIQDATGHEFATRLGNVFTIGKGTKPWVSLPKGKGIKLSIIEEARKRLAAQGATTA